MPRRTALARLQVLFTFVTGSVLLVPGKACAGLLAFLRPYILDTAYKQLTEASTQLAVVQSLIAKGAEGAGAAESSELAAAQQIQRRAQSRIRQMTPADSARWAPAPYRSSEARALC